MSELFETIEMKADQAKIKAKNKAEAEKAAQEAREEERRRAAHAKRNKATHRMVTRLAITLALVAGLWLSGKFGLIAEQLIVWMYGAAGSWFTYWLGAYVQFMWCKGGYMEC